VLALERGILGRKSWWAAATFPILMLGVGVHFLFLMLAPLTLPAAAVLLLRRRWLALAVGLATALLLVVPLVVHLRATDFQEYRDLRYRGTLPARVDLEGLQFVLRAPTGWDGPVAEVLPLSEGLPPPLAEALPPISVGLLVGGVVAGMARLLVPGTPRGLRARLAGLLVWLLLPAALTVRHQLDLHPHYYLMTLPASFLLIGAGVQWLVAWLGRAVLPVSALGVLVLVATQSLAAGRLLAGVSGAPQACYGAPLEVSRRTAADLLAFGGSSRRVAFENNPAGEAPPLAYLVRPGFATLELARPDYEGLSGPGSPPDPWSVAAAPGPLTRSAERLDVSYPNGVRLASASLASDPWPGWRPRLALVWTVEEASADGPIAWQADLLDASGARVSSQTGLSHAVAGLAGQQVTSWIFFDLPPGPGTGDYRAGLQLLAGPNLEPAAAEVWLSRPVHVVTPPPCVRSVMP
jgi:hypothetical protein